MMRASGSSRARFAPIPPEAASDEADVTSDDASGGDMSQQSPGHGPAGPEGPGHWSQARWQPEPGVVPIPVQRHPADPQLGGWAIAEPGAATIPAPDAGTTPGDHAPQRPDHTMRWVVVGAVLAGALVTAGVVLGGKLVEQSVEHQVSTLPDLKVTTQLAAAGHALDLYRAEAGTNPVDLTPLAQYGFRPDDDVTVQILPVSGDGYCLAGGPAGEAPTEWYSDADGLTQTPCG